MTIRFRDRQAAGIQLAKALSVYDKQPNTLVLGLPRGGVPVAYEVARALQLPLDICLVRKLGLPGYPELAMGAISLGGVRTFNYDVIDSFQVSEDAIESVAQSELQELERRNRLYRGHRPPSEVAGRRVILIDDGLATGSTMQAAIAVINAQQPEEIVVAVPVSPLNTYWKIRRQVSWVICLSTPDPFSAIGLWYERFPQIADEQVIRQLSCVCVQRAADSASALK